MYKHNVVITFYGIYLEYKYFDSSAEQNELYMETLVQLQCLLDQNNSDAPSIIMEDMNTALPVTQKISNNWFCKKPFTQWSALLYDFISQMICVWPTSYWIRMLIIPKFFSNQVTKCDILDSAEDNVSDHLAISSTLLVYVPHCKTERDQYRHSTPPAFPLAKWSDVEFV